MAIKKGPTKGSGGKHRNKLKGYGPTPKAEDRVYHKAYKAKKAAERRQMADPRLAARRRVDKFASADTSDLVYAYLLPRCTSCLVLNMTIVLAKS